MKPSDIIPKGKSEAVKEAILDIYRYPKNVADPNDETKSIKNPQTEDEHYEEAFNTWVNSEIEKVVNSYQHKKARKEIIKFKL